MSKSRGLSLVEVLLAVTIMTFIGSAIYVTFSQGLRVWQRVQLDRPAQDAELVFEKMNSDLRNMWANDTASFLGDEQSFSFFATTADTAGDPKGLYTLGRYPNYITYAFNPAERALERTQEHFLTAANPDRSHEKSRRLGARIHVFRIAYYYYDARHEHDVWQHTWTESCIPDAIKVEMSFGHHAAEQTVLRYVSIPMGNCAVG